MKPGRLACRRALRHMYGPEMPHAANSSLLAIRAHEGDAKRKCANAVHADSRRGQVASLLTPPLLPRYYTCLPVRTRGAWWEDSRNCGAIGSSILPCHPSQPTAWRACLSTRTYLRCSNADLHEGWGAFLTFFVPCPSPRTRCRNTRGCSHTAGVAISSQLHVFEAWLSRPLPLSLES